MFVMWNCIRAESEVSCKLAHCSLETPKRIICQTVETQIRRRKTRRLIRVSTVCKKFNHFSLGISKLHSLTHLKSKLESSNISCVGVLSVYNGLTSLSPQGVLPPFQCSSSVVILLFSCVDGFMGGTCCVIVCSSSLLLVPREGCASW